MLETLEIVLQLLMHHRELLSVQAVEGVEGIEGVLLRRLLAGGVVMMLMMMMMLLKQDREILPLRVVTHAALVAFGPGVLVPRGGRAGQPTGTRA